MKPASYFNALIQLIPIKQISLFDEILTREEMFRKVFENDQLIRLKESNNISWAIGNAKYLSNKRWIFGFLNRVSDITNIATIPDKAISLSEIQNLSNRLVFRTPFFFDFKRQLIYTQSHYQIVRTSRSAAKIWRLILQKRLLDFLEDLDVRPLPDQTTFWEKINELEVVNAAEFYLFGPNALNEERIKSLISEFTPTETTSLGIVLKNYVNGLRIDAEEFKELLKYLFRGGGKGTFRGRDKDTKLQKKIETDSKTQQIPVTLRLSQDSSQEDILKVLNEFLKTE